MKTITALAAAALMLVLLPSVSASETVRLDKAVFMDHCKGAWAGQMFGVCFGSPTEFSSNGKPIEGELRAWKPEMIEEALGQDDCYVEMTFLKAIEDYGIDVSFEQAGKAFGESKYPLWHANRYGRENVRRGIMPPLSGHPLFNVHADDIDFQIEADLFGILCPGLPLESNRLCEVFGHIMNYGDGVYGGMFVAGMYAAAYFEPNDVRKVVEAGLACIPEQSQYYQCISDVIRWHEEQPGDWLAVWRNIEDKWQDDIDCGPGNAFNIDAKLNGAYIAMGLLYGAGDMLKTAEIATRCGQDSDCNPSNAAGVLGCMKGFSALDPAFVSGLDAIRKEKFIHTDYSFEGLLEACQRVTEKLVVRAGGTVEAGAYVYPVQAPRPPVTFEQWVDQKGMLCDAIPASEMQMWSPDWRVVACGNDMDPGFQPEAFGRETVLMLHPVSETEAAAIEATLNIPEGAKTLTANVASDTRGDFVLRMLVNGNVLKEQTVDTKGEWIAVEGDIAPYAGQTVTVRIENAANGWKFEAAYLDSVEIR